MKDTEKEHYKNLIPILRHPDWQGWDNDSFHTYGLIWWHLPIVVPHTIELSNSEAYIMMFPNRYEVAFRMTTLEYSQHNISYNLPDSGNMNPEEFVRMCVKTAQAELTKAVPEIERKKREWLQELEKIRKGS